MNERKRQVIIKAQQLFMEKGFAATSVQDILDKADISKGTFYNYFTSKNECLMAILDYGRDEIIIKRRELLIGKKRSNKNVLAEQIAVRLKINQEHNLFPIFQAIFYSNDHDLKEFVNKHHLEEINWLAHRLVDVYGEEVAPYTIDCAIMAFGIIQHQLHVCADLTKEALDILGLIHFTLRRIDEMIKHMVVTEDTFLGDKIFLSKIENQNTLTKQQLINRLVQIEQTINHKAINNNDEYIQFIVEELQTETPRKLILRSIIRTFREAYINTKFMNDVRKVTTDLWKYIDTIE